MPQINDWNAIPSVNGGTFVGEPLDNLYWLVHESIESYGISSDESRRKAQRIIRFAEKVEEISA